MGKVGSLSLGGAGGAGNPPPRAERGRIGEGRGRPLGGRGEPSGGRSPAWPGWLTAPGPRASRPSGSSPFWPPAPLHADGQAPPAGAALSSGRPRAPPSRSSRALGASRLAARSLARPFYALPPTPPLPSAGTRRLSRRSQFLTARPSPLAGSAPSAASAEGGTVRTSLPPQPAKGKDEPPPAVHPSRPGHSLHRAGGRARSAGGRRPEPSSFPRAGALCRRDSRLPGGGLWSGRPGSPFPTLRSRRAKQPRPCPALARPPPPPAPAACRPSELGRRGLAQKWPPSRRRANGPLSPLRDDTRLGGGRGRGSRAGAEGVAACSPAAPPSPARGGPMGSASEPAEGGAAGLAPQEELRPPTSRPARLLRPWSCAVVR